MDETDRLRAKLSPGLIEECKRRGMSQSDIARAFNVTRAAVSAAKRRHGSYSQTPREVVNEHFPWTVGARFADATLSMRMRDHGEFWATGGDGMSHNQLRRLRSFYELLTQDNAVVEFDPAILPVTTGPRKYRNKVGGFTLRPRVAADGDLLIRVNEHTTLTDEGRRIWRMPREWPKA